MVVTDEMVEAGAKALHDHWQNGFRPWAETCERLPGQARSFRGKARVTLEAALNATARMRKIDCGSF